MRILDQQLYTSYYSMRYHTIIGLPMLDEVETNYEEKLDQNLLKHHTTGCLQQCRMLDRYTASLFVKSSTGC